MRAIFVFLFAAAFLGGGDALAQPARNKGSKIDRAREMGERGVALYKRGQYGPAVEMLRRAEELHHAPTLVLYIARSYDKLGRLLDALAQYREILAEELPKDAPDQFIESRAAAHAEVDLLIPRIPSVELAPRGPPNNAVTLIVNGREVPRVKWPRLEIDPGEHTFEAKAAGHRPVAKNIIVPEGARMVIELELEPVAQPSPTPAPTTAPLPLWPAWVGIGVGAAGVIVGAITGGLHLAKVDDLRGRCRPDNRCPQADADEASTAQTLATVSTVTIIAGGVLAAVGVTYAIVVLSTEDETASASLHPNGVSLSLRF